MERERERQKIRELKKRRLHCHGGLSLSWAGVSIRKDGRECGCKCDCGPMMGMKNLNRSSKGRICSSMLTMVPPQRSRSPPTYRHGRRADEEQASRTHTATAKDQQWQDEENSWSSKKRKRRAGSVLDQRLCLPLVLQNPHHRLPRRRI